MPTEDEFVALRNQMVTQQILNRGIRQPHVLQALATVPRHEFVARELIDQAYADRPLPIGHGQTISQPYMVALMTELACPTVMRRVLEVGTGCGYQAAVLAEVAQEVFSIEIVEPLAIAAQQRLAMLDYHNVQVRHGDGYQGWPEQAPFDAILLAAAPPKIPPPLLDQLAVGGRMVIPLGTTTQDLWLIERLADGQFKHSQLTGVRFVPMTGEAQR
jgi:protein-L-isoaspartate(D-aspartate) O-methyltransferase